MRNTPREFTRLRDHPLQPCLARDNMADYEAVDENPYLSNSENSAMAE